MNESHPQSVSVAASPASSPRSDVARLAARGTIYITIAKAYFTITGLATYLALPRLLTVEEFGLYSVAVGVASIINAVVMTGTVQTVSKFVSQDETRSEVVRRKAFQLQFLIGGGMAGGYFLLAPLIAHALNDPRLAAYFRITAFITFCYSIYAIFLGTLNGRKEFLKQASLDVAYSTFKMMFVIGLAWLGYAVVGALVGWLMASLCVLVISIFVVGRREPVGEARARELLGFQSMALLFILVVNGLQKVDLLLVKALSSPDPQLASNMSGYYNAVMTIANVTFQSIIAITFVAFPLISASTFNADHSTTRKYISQTLRVSLMIMAVLATVFSSNAAGLLGLIYRREYLVGAPALMIAPLGMLLFGFFYVLTTIITSSGRPRVSVCIGLLTILADACFNWLLIPRYALWGAAVATAGAMFIGAGMGAIYVSKRFGALLPVRSVVRVSLAGLLIYFLPELFPARGLIMLARVVVQIMAYAGVLVLMKEIGADEFQAIRQMLSRQGISTETPSTSRSAI
jgi:O-antigen/teichoic acid export membrane protein